MSEEKIMNERLHVAMSVMRFFTEGKKISATTQLCDPGWLHKKGYQPMRELKNSIIKQYRSETSNDSIVSKAHYAMSTLLGNCGEQSKIVYMSLYGNPILLRQKPYCHITLCELIGEDHLFVMITDFPIRPDSAVVRLGRTALIVDPWMTDVYFPNSQSFGVSYYPGREQRKLRNLILSRPISPIDEKLMPDFPLQYVASKTESTKF